MSVNKVTTVQTHLSLNYQHFLKLEVEAREVFIPPLLMAIVAVAAEVPVMPGHPEQVFRDKAMLAVTERLPLNMAAVAVAEPEVWAEMLAVHGLERVDQEQAHIQRGLLLLPQVRLGFMLAVEAVQGIKMLEHKG